MEKFYSNGKLLLSGEYLILDGALGLAVPAVFGQELAVEHTEQVNIITWKSLNKDDSIWFEAKFNVPHFEIVDLKGDEKVANTLIKILRKAKEFNQNFLDDPTGYSVVTKLFFNRDWGLGSSSTLINNIAQWAKVDAFDLLFKSFGGSGYDIACAQNDQSIVYKLMQGVPSVEQVLFDPPFKDQLYFVHLNKKQRSSESIKSYKQRKLNPSAIKRISDLTKELLLSNTTSDFNHVLKEHEKLMSTILGESTIQEKYFSDYKGQTKSLGAWGGDFILASGDDSSPDYFKQKGFDTVIPYTSMIK